MNIKTLKIFVLPLLLAVTLGGIYLMPRKGGGAGFVHQHGPPHRHESGRLARHAPAGV